MTTNGWKGNQFVLVLVLILQSQVTLEDGHSGEEHGPPAPQAMSSQSRFQTDFGQSREEESSESQSEESEEESEEGSDEVRKGEIQLRLSNVITRVRVAITVKRRNMKPLTKRKK